MFINQKWQSHVIVSKNVNNWSVCVHIFIYMYVHLCQRDGQREIPALSIVFLTKNSRVNVSVSSE